MNKKQVNTAARAYALEELGEAQFKSNKDAVRSITDNFKAGAAACQKLFKPVAKTPVEKSNFERVWNDFWKDICTNPNGSINLEQVKRELADYHGILEEVSKVYDTLTRGNISKPNTLASAVIAEVERIHQEELDELEKELTEDDEEQE
ncbi:hypothetical protein [Hymenobacter sp. YC55]|uniref:hypothetical protein n=1 Tax=Hymenobacter sp. YC55 TaxID=3034019 RepID=UPI0023F78CD6|nr:hypothetical protein [Hymenobacter sp. YC55]MDF7810718.1 hypothetical protein [Hymenobacter sp. YC55]